MGSRRIATLAMLGLIWVGPVRGNLIGSVTFSATSEYPGSLSSIELGLAVSPTSSIGTGPYLLTGPVDSTITVPKLFTFDKSSPGFSATAATLTNDQPDNVKVSAIIGGTPQMTRTAYESETFVGSLFNGAVDFSGYSIDNINLTINNIRIQSDQDGATGLFYDTTVDICGSKSTQAVPTPGAACFGMIGLICMGLLRRIAPRHLFLS